MTVRDDRFALLPGGTRMKAVVTTGVGGLETLDYRDVPLPAVGPGEALVRVLAAGLNNVDVNTRVGWYSASVTAGTVDLVATPPDGRQADGGWDQPTPFPLIQGADCCGIVAALCPPGPGELDGGRVVIRPCMRPAGFGDLRTVWLGSDVDGAFAQYVRVPASEVFPVVSELADAELAALPCAYGTAENLLRRAGVTAGERVLVTGASGGVGAAVVQLATARGALVIAATSPGKSDAVRALGAELVVPRDGDLAGQLGPQSVDVLVDNVSGPGFGRLLELLRRGGRYITAGAVAGPLVTLDKRTLYLRDLTLIGCTAWDEPVFPAVLAAVERGEVRPPVAATFALRDMAAAQTAFLEKRRVGKIVVVPPTPD
jgi:NADPH:quinone reductase-like Zn-dependent oxidoreductase